MTHMKLVEENIYNFIRQCWLGSNIVNCTVEDVDESIKFVECQKHDKVCPASLLLYSSLYDVIGASHVSSACVSG